MLASRNTHVGQVVAWLRDMGDQVVLDSEKRDMQARGGVAGPRVAAGFAIPLVVDPAFLGARVAAYELEGGLRVEKTPASAGPESWAVRAPAGLWLARDGAWLAAGGAGADAERCSFPTAADAITAAAGAGVPREAAAAEPTGRGLRL